MKGLDWIIAPLAIACFAFSVCVIIWFVPEPGLVVVCLLAVALGVYDFALSAFDRHKYEIRDK